MDTQIDILRNHIHKLLYDGKIMASEELLRISKEMDQLTIKFFIAQTRNQIRKEACL